MSRGLQGPVTPRASNRQRAVTGQKTPDFSRKSLPECCVGPSPTLACGSWQDLAPLDPFPPERLLNPGGQP